MVSQALREAKERYRSTPKGRASQRRMNLKKKYGLTPEAWDLLFAFQGRRCAACRTPDPKSIKGWHTDHNHVTKRVRGILCHACNLALGNVRDDTTHLRSLVAYLERVK